MSTIPYFFEVYDNAMVMVRGSDSKMSFANQCRKTCRKKCGNICKNMDRRIRAYQSYVEKNYENLQNDYNFFGGIQKFDNQLNMEPFVSGSKYDFIFLLKKHC